MEGVSRHYDHTLGRCVMGQLGLVSEEKSNFLQLDNQIYISSKKITGLKRAHKDGRSPVARLWRQGLEMSKPELVEVTLKRVLHKGFRVPYLVADSRYSRKNIMKLAIQNGMYAVLRMKKGKIKYQVQVGTDKKTAVERLADLCKARQEELAQAVRAAVAARVSALGTGTAERLQARIDMESVATSIRARTKKNTADSSPRDWALFISTDDQLSTEKLLQICSLHWSVEVYFKEAKQNLGFLSEKTRSFASFIASIHLCAVRHLMLAYVISSDGSGHLCEIREQFKDQLNQFSLARRLWHYFLGLLGRVIYQMKTLSNDGVNRFVSTLNREFEQLSKAASNWTRQPCDWSMTRPPNLN